MWPFKKPKKRVLLRYVPSWSKTVEYETVIIAEETIHGSLAYIYPSMQEGIVRLHSDGTFDGYHSGTWRLL